MQHKKLKIGLVIAFSFFLIIAATPKARAADPWVILSLLMPNAVYSGQAISDEQFVVFIVNRDVGFVHATLLNDSDAPVGSGHGFIYPLSRILNVIQWLLGGAGHAISIENMRVIGNLNPFYEIYNDTNEDGFLTITRSNITNTTEASHFLVPYCYEKAYFDNLTPQQSLYFSDDKPTTYTWGVDFKNVKVGAFNATLDNATGNPTSEWIANDSFAWINNSYAYIFSRSNNWWQFNHSITFGQYNDDSEEGIYVNKSLATVHYHIAMRVNLGTSPTITNNASIEFNETHTNHTPYLETRISGEYMGKWDMTETKPNYTVDSEVYAAIGVSTPIAEISCNLNITNHYFYDGNIDVNITGTAAASRVCYPIWNGTVLSHDPYYFLPLLYPEIPIWWAWIPDILNAGVAIAERNMLIVLLVLLLAFVIAILAFAGGKKGKEKYKKRKTKKKKQKSAEHARAVKKSLKKRETKEKKPKKKKRSLKKRKSQ